MEFGICIPHYGKPVEVDRIVGVARYAEELDFDSVWVTDHIIVPRTLEIIYRDNMLEPLVMLSHLASVVQRPRIGTSVIILPYRHPILVAKMLASIDQLSKGRLIFGVGAGWMEEEFHALNTPFADRGALSDENLRIIRDCWTQETINFQGRFYNYSDMQASPRPVQAGGPPIWVGGNSPRSRRRAAELGDGWHSTGTLASDMAAGCNHVRELWEKNGRKGAPVFSTRIGLFIEGISQAVLSYPPRAGRSRSEVRGSIAEVVDELAAYKELGLQHVVLETSTQSHDSTLATMEALMTKIKPQLV